MKVSTSYKSFSKALSVYETMKASDKILPLKEFEELSKYFGKKGKPLAHKLRSEKAKKEFNKALKSYNKRFGTGGKKRLEREVKAQEERLEKQVTKALVKGSGKRTKAFENLVASQTKTSKFQALAKREVEKRKQAVKAFSSETTRQLRDKLNVGSGTIQYLAIEKGYTQKMIDAYLSNLKREYDLLSPEAKRLANSDTLNKAIRELTDYYGDNTAGALAGYLYGLDAGRGDEIFDALEFYSQAQKEYGDKIDFSQYTTEDFMKEIDAEYDEWNINNMIELMENKIESEED